MKEELIKKIKDSLGEPSKGRNSMGASENYYNCFYMVGKCFSEDELAEFDEKALENLLRLADFAGDVFY